MREYTTTLGLDDCVTWTGYCEDEVASAYLRAADACVLAFVQGVRLNNTSYAVAAAHGLPVVTTRGESLESDFIDRHNVLLCWASDPKDLAEGLVEVARDNQLRETLRAGITQIGRRRTSWAAVTRQRMQLLFPERQFAGSPRPSTPDAAATDGRGDALAVTTIHEVTT
jgi:glycosyltransferase involved in cell wall biosynthesis